MNNTESGNSEESSREIDIKHAWDVNFWCDELNLRADDLKEIVKQVGPAVHDVRVHLAKNLIVNWPLAY